MNKYAAAVLGAGSLWGIIGIFTREMAVRGFDSSGILIVRCGVASLFFAATLLIKDPGLFRVRLRDFWCFFGAGICSLLFFSYCYFRAISLMSLSAAAILLYTAPSLVVVFSAVLFGEKLRLRPVLAVAMAFIGCVLVSGIGGAISLAGFVFGLCSGLGYALYSVFARFALLRGYDSRTVNFYACLLCTLGAVVIWGGGKTLSLMFAGAGNFAWCLSLGVVSCYLPYLLYTYGLTGLETGKASVMASVEPVVATVAGYLVFSESLSVMSFCGMALVLGAVVLLNLKRPKESQAR